MENSILIIVEQSQPQKSGNITYFITMQMTNIFEIMVPMFVCAAVIWFCVHLLIIPAKTEYYRRLSVRQDELEARTRRRTRAATIFLEESGVTREAIMALMRSLAEIEATPLEQVNVRLQPGEYHCAVTPVVGSSKHRRNPEEVATCAICQDVMEDGTTLHQIGCGHRYHAVCLTEWLQKQCRLPQCPLCRFDVRVCHKVESSQPVD